MSVIKSHQWLNKDKIETLADDLLRDMQGTVNAPKWPFVADRAANFLKLGIDLCSIPLQDNRPVVARIYPTERLIQFNLDIPGLMDNRGFEQSTLAHEIGHWMLHVNQDEAAGFSQQLELSLDRKTQEQPFLCRVTNEQQIYQSSANKQLDSREWQAQHFASCLLMPRYKLQEASRGRDLTNYKHLNAMKDELGVTISNLKHRLKDLGLIHTVEGSKQIYPGKSFPNGQTGLF